MSVTFSYGGSTIILRNPELDNSDKVSFDRLQKNTRGGDLLIFRDPAWPKLHTFMLRFRLIKKADLFALVSFVRGTLGKTITYVDYEGRTWTGMFIKPVMDATQEFRDDSDNYEVTLDFETSSA